MKPSRPDVPAETTATLADRYPIVRQIGSGGMAVVYLAEDLKHQRQVAIKIMKPSIVEALGHERFLREIGIAARLNHPHVVPLFDSGRAAECLFYVMPYVKGESLRLRLSREGQLPLDEALRLAREVASALAHAHQHGLVHRDVKPENILLADGIALVSDFGIAHSIDVSADAQTRAGTGLGTILGTPQYMSPEQACGEAVTASSDVYSLACVVFEMLTGQPPFAASSGHSALRLHLTAEPPSVSALRPAVPSSLSRVIERGLAKRPADRYGTAVQFAEALAAAAAEGSLTPPAFARAPQRPHNLPRQRTHFIGREKELAECARLLDGTRMLTLTGVGGCGKTRLAIELAEYVLPSFPDGVWFADLAPLTDGGRVVETVASAMGVRETAGVDLAHSVYQHVAGKRLLLVLDNCEHVLADASAVSDRLVEAGDGVRIVATSREGLGVAGEHLLPLRSLSLPVQAALPDVAAIQASESVRLFVDRARRVVPDFDVTAQNAAVVAEICRRLDGIPLAIELAAARVKVLSVDQIRERLDDRFRLLTGGAKTALARHQTLQAAIEWSHDHLTGDEQRLFRQLAVFSGGWSFDMLTRVVSDGDEFEVLDQLSRLVDKSLVLVDRRPSGEPHYSLLETVRQYALGRLKDAGETERVRARHLDEFVALAERGHAGRLLEEDRWSQALEADNDNLRSALDHLRSLDSERHLQLAGALAWFWLARSYLHEGHEQLTAALAATSPQPSRPVRARALSGFASLLAWQGDGAAAAVAWREALQIWRDVGDERELALALEGAGWAEFVVGNDEESYSTFEECIRLERASGDPHRINRAMLGVGQVAVALDRVDVARACAAEILRYCERHPNTRSEHMAYHYLADCALLESNFNESLSLYGESLRLALVLGDHLEIGFEVQGVAMSLAGLGRSADAVRLAAGVEADWQRVGVKIGVRFWSALIQRHIGGAIARLGAEAGRVRAEGLALSFDETTQLAMASATG